LELGRFWVQQLDYYLALDICLIDKHPEINIFFGMQIQKIEEILEEKQFSRL
jgi:hypothetical protein